MVKKEDISYNEENEYQSDSLAQDLGKYIETILRQWQLIVAIILVCAFLVGLISVIIPKNYRASVLIASTKVASIVSFGSNIHTLSEEQLLTSGSGAYGLVDRKARLMSYVQMVGNPAVAQAVIDQLGDRLDKSDHTVTDLLRHVKGDVASTSDSIKISVTYKDPKVAADIANAWGQAFVAHVNSTYSESGASSSVVSIKTQTAQAKQAYDVTQVALVDFTKNNQIDELSRQITETQGIVNTLSAAQSTLQKSAFNEQVKNLQMKLGRAYDDIRRIELLLNNTEDMRAQVSSGGEGAAESNSLALNLLKAQIFASSQDLTQNLVMQTSPITLTPEAMLADLDSLVVTLNHRHKELTAEIDTITNQMAANDEKMTSDVSDTPLETKLQELENKLLDLKARLAEQIDTRNELTRSHDLAWNTYQTLATKEAELQVAAETSGTEVALAMPAAIPDKDIVSTTKNTVFAGAFGLVLGLAAAFSLEFWWNYKGIPPRAIQIWPYFQALLHKRS